MNRSNCNHDVPKEVQVGVGDAGDAAADGAARQPLRGGRGLGSRGRDGAGGQSGGRSSGHADIPGASRGGGREEEEEIRLCR